MSLRRRSCNACFRGRRKCDLAFPTCQRCEKTGKNCQYITAPAPAKGGYSSSTVLSPNILTNSNNEISPCQNVLDSDTSQWDLIESSLDSDLQIMNFDFTTPDTSQIASNLLGELGDLLPLRGNLESWQWVVEQLRECPKAFAEAGENMFIHRSTYRHQSPPAIKAAFGICTASQMVTPATKVMFTSSLESEASMLLDKVEVESVPEGLARLQAMVLYQILRLLSGDSTQQSAAERQKSVICAWALQLLQQIHPDSLRSLTYEDIIIVESVRRTVMMNYLIHALGSIFKHGVCFELPTLALLPLSIDSDAWESGNVLCDFSSQGDTATMKYGEWTDTWVAFLPRRRLDAYQKLLMVACKGKAKVEELESEIL